MIDVIVADDQALVRDAFSLLVDTEPDMRVVGRASNGEDAVALARHTRPDVAVMDIRMPGRDGIDATRTITADPQCNHTRIVILTTFDVDQYIFAAIRAGASGFLLKDTPAADFLAALRIVAAGEALLTPSVTRRLISDYASIPMPSNRIKPQLDQVTDREREILVLVGRGLSNDDICQQLHLSMSTTKTHIGRLLAKLAARDRAQLVVAAYESGLLDRRLSTPTVSDRD